MNDLIRKASLLKLVRGNGESQPDRRPRSNPVARPPLRVGVVETVLGGKERVAALGVLFPQVRFAPVGEAWSDHATGRFDVLVAPVDAASPTEVEQAARRLKFGRAGERVVVALSNADVATTRRLLRDGAADVLPAPVGEPALAVSLERLFATEVRGGGKGGGGEVVAFLKAGGGVGATALAVQSAIMLAKRRQGDVCVADLDVQFGAVALYLDATEALTVTDCLAAGEALAETPFATALSEHASRLRILAAPKELTPLEALSPGQIEDLLKGLKRDFALTLLDLPSVWTAWTNRALQLSDRIVIVTQLTVPRVHLLKRQLRVLINQGLETRELLLVCNALTADQQESLSLRSAERALGRPFDHVLPEDRKLMYAAINQGVEISPIRKGAKLEKALAEFADRLGERALQDSKLQLSR